VAEDHQTKNAMALVENNAAILVKDVNAVELLGNEIVRLFDDGEKRNELSENIARMGKRKAANSIRNEIIKLCRKD